VVVFVKRKGTVVAPPAYALGLELPLPINLLSSITITIPEIRYSTGAKIEVYWEMDSIAMLISNF